MSTKWVSYLASHELFTLLSPSKGPYSVVYLTLKVFAFHAQGRPALTAIDTVVAGLRDIKW